jgi:hypothetical protein
MTIPTLDEMLADGLWERVRQSLRDDGLDPDEVEARAAANLANVRIGEPRELTEQEIADVVAWIMDDSHDPPTVVIR